MRNIKSKKKHPYGAKHIMTLQLHGAIRWSHLKNLVTLSSWDLSSLTTSSYCLERTPGLSSFVYYSSRTAPFEINWSFFLSLPFLILSFSSSPLPPTPPLFAPWLQTWPFMIAGKPENELKEAVNTTRLCGPTASWPRIFKHEKSTLLCGWMHLCIVYMERVGEAFQGGNKLFSHGTNKS